MTYREEKIYHVHEDKDEVADACVVVSVAGPNQATSDKVMS